LHAGHPCQVGPGIGAPVADEGQYVGFSGFHIELKFYSVHLIEDRRMKIEYLWNSVDFNFLCLPSF
jgi:hypothetical protein